MSFSYDSLQDFHRFILEGYSYDKADKKMYAAYRLYSLLSDGISGLTENEIKVALDFASEYALPAEQLRILQILFEQKDYLLRTDIQSFLCVMHYAISKYEVLSEDYHTVIKNLMVDRVLYDFLTMKVERMHLHLSRMKSILFAEIVVQRCNRTNEKEQPVKSCLQ